MSVDQRIVQMKFDNAQFGTGAKSTLDQLAALKAALKLDGASKGLEEVSKTAGKFSTENMQQQIGRVASHFSALQVAAVTALATIVHKATEAGSRLVKSLSVDPIMEGLREYETNLNSIQTIMANTGLKGAAGLKTVSDALDELNRYADLTIYNFSEMARNIGTFTAAGVDLDVSVAAIKGIANLAAISGSNSQQASTAMYQLSQALSAGRVSLMDWNSVVNAGMGGEVFRNSLLETAKVHGEAVDKILSGEVSFRDSLQEGWLTAEVLTETLSKFTGELTADQLKSMGYTEAQIAGILEMGETAVNAATKVKTMSQLLDTLRESAGSGWARTWQLIFGDFDEAKTLFTNVNDVLGGMISSSADARNALIEEWKDLGGRDALIQGIANGFHALLAILRPVRDAFREIFPAITAQQLVDLTVRFRDFMESLKIGEDTANNLRRTFAGFFAILGIGWELLKAGIGFFLGLFGSATEGSGGILEFTGTVGDFLVILHAAIKQGNLFTRFFDKIGSVIEPPLALLKKFIEFVGNLSDGINAEGASSAISNLINGIEPMQALGDLVSAAWSNTKRVLADVFAVFEPLADKMAEWAKKIPGLFGDAFGSFSYEGMIDGIQTGFLGALVTALIVGVKSFLKGGGIFQNITDALGNLTGTLNSMQNTLRAATLLQIAAAITLLAIAVTILSHIDPEGLTSALAAISIIFVQLGAAMIAFERIGTAGQAAKLIIMGGALILLGGAILVFASAVKKLSDIPMDELTKGLVGVTILLAALTATTRLMNTSTGGMIRTAAGLVILGLAIRILVESVEELGSFSWEELTKGLIGVGALLGALALFTRLAAVNASGIRQGAGIILLAIALKILASAVGDFAEYDWIELAKGMASIAVGLGLIAGAINFIPAGAVLKAAGVAIIAASLQMIGDAVKSMAEMSWIEIARGMTVMAAALTAIAVVLSFMPISSILNAAAILVVASSLGIIQNALADMAGMDSGAIKKSLITMAIALGIIAAAVNLMSGALGGAAAIFVVAAALSILTPILIAMGNMSWGEIVKGLVALAGVFLVIGAAGLILAPVVPVIFALAGAVALFGVAVLAAGAGVFMFALGMTALAAAGAGAAVAIVAIVGGLIGLLPMVAEQIGLALIAFTKVIATAGPAITAAITAVLIAFMNAIQELTPEIGDTLIALIDLMLRIILSSTPKLIDAGFKILIAFLQGIANNIPRIANVAADIVVRFINTIAGRQGSIIQAGFNLILAFINGLANAVRNNSGAMGDAGWNLASAMVEGVVRGLQALAGNAARAAANMARDALNAAKKAIGISSPSKDFKYEVGKESVMGVAEGLEEFAPVAAKASANVGRDIVDAMGKTIAGLDELVRSDAFDLNPVIQPVLDLSTVKKDAANLFSMFDIPPFEVESTYSGASKAAEGHISNQDAEETFAPDRAGDTYNFTQNNTSPKALPAAEIYRKTKSVIALAKKRGDLDRAE